MISDLPGEVKDRLEIKEQTDPTFSRVMDFDYTDTYESTLDERGDVRRKHSYIATFYGEQGSGKSYGALSTMGRVSKGEMPVENVFFSYKDAVKARRGFKPGSAIMVDEQSREFGLDSMRVSSILTGLKEQLRKRSIHMAYCAPTLKEEYHSSMYVFESLFIDRLNKESYFAYRTRELHCLGHVVIPHPLTFFGKDFLDEYERRKDDHLDKLLDLKSEDDIQEFADQAVKNDLFLKAEEVYVAKLGRLPKTVLSQLLMQIFPEFQGGVMIFEICDRIKMLKELGGEWVIPGGKKD